MSQQKIQSFNKSLTSDLFGPTLELWLELLLGHRTGWKMFQILAQKIKLGNSFPPDSSRQPETLRRWTFVMMRTACENAKRQCFAMCHLSHPIRLWKRMEKQSLFSFYAPSLKIKTYYIPWSRKVSSSDAQLTSSGRLAAGKPTSYLDISQGPFDLISFQEFSWRVKEARRGSTNLPFRYISDKRKLYTPSTGDLT